MMKNDSPTKETIRQYLLGRLDDQTDLEKRLSEQMLFDDELSEIVDSIEDEIIEDYLDGAVSASDRATIEKYFFRPAERREKLKLARLLRSHFQVTGDAATKKKLAPYETLPNREGKGDPAPSLHWLFQTRTWCELAALVLLVAGGFIYVSRVRHRFDSELAASRQAQMRLDGELAQERERSASLTKQLLEVQPPIAILTFLGPVFRDRGSSPVVAVRPWTQQIRVELGLQGAPSGAYNVRLENSAGRTIWSQSGVTASSGGLRFEMPAQSLSPGTYCLKVSSRPASYCFQVRGAKQTQN
jgi:hypothetical protein